MSKSLKVCLKKWYEFLHHRVVLRNKNLICNKANVWDTKIPSAHILLSLCIIPEISVEALISLFSHRYIFKLQSEVSACEVFINSSHLLWFLTSYLAQVAPSFFFWYGGHNEINQTVALMMKLSSTRVIIHHKMNLTLQQIFTEKWMNMWSIDIGGGVLEMVKSLNILS